MANGQILKAAHGRLYHSQHYHNFEIAFFNGTPVITARLCKAVGGRGVSPSIWKYCGLLPAVLLPYLRRWPFEPGTFD